VNQGGVARIRSKRRRKTPGQGSSGAASNPPATRVERNSPVPGPEHEVQRARPRAAPADLGANPPKEEVPVRTNARGRDGEDDDTPLPAELRGAFPERTKVI